MAIYDVGYCNRDDVKTATDMKGTAYNNAQIDRALQEASRTIEGHLHRKFYPFDGFKFFDWPPQGGQGGGQITYPWRLWMDANDLVSISSLESPVGTSLNTAYVNLEPQGYGPPYTYVELQRDKNIAFSSGPSPQRSIKITGTWGWSTDMDVIATLSGGINASVTSLTVSNGSDVGPGNVIILDTERMIVQEKLTGATVDTQQGSGCSTAKALDNVLTLVSGASVNLGETILLDAEKMLVLDITANNVTVKRAYDGTVLATHSGANVYAYRNLTVLRGQLGTTAASHTNGVNVNKHRVPYLIRNLAIAEAVNIILQETGGYSNPQGEGQSAVHGLGSALADKWDEARTVYGRKSRTRVV